jgi:hypothetical protein
MYIYTPKKILKGFASFKTSHEALPVVSSLWALSGGALKKAKKYVSLRCYG